MTATQRPVVTRYRGADYSEMSLQTAAAGNRSCVICRKTIQRHSVYLYAVVRVDKTTTRRHICRACCLKREDSELHRNWNRLLDQRGN